MATRETHKPASEAVQPTASLASKLAAIDLWGSEVPIVATKSGNADGAKGHRFKQDDAGRHAPDPEPGTRMTLDLCRLTQKAKSIKGFFTHVSHEHLLRFLRYRIGDERLIRIIRRFLKAGVMEDGVFSATEEGTPQGGLVSPVLANIYLHYVLDWWFEGRLAKTCRGKAYLIRYADDFVACFQEEADARQFLKELRERLAAFGLETEPTKTAILKFGMTAWIQSRRPEGPRTETFNLLGFTHYITTSRNGRFQVGRKTEVERMRKKLKELSQKLKALRVAGGAAMTQYVQRHLRGHFSYYAISGNSRSVGEYGYRVMQTLFKWLNRRSQKRSLTWEKYLRLLRAGLLPKPRIRHNL